MSRSARTLHMSFSTLWLIPTQQEEHDIFARAQNELEALRQEVAAKDQELERLRDSLTSPSDAVAPNSLGDEVLESARQLDLSAAHQRIRSLEDALYTADARSHNLQLHIATLEQQLAGRAAVAQRAISPPTARASFSPSPPAFPVSLRYGNSGACADSGACAAPQHASEASSSTTASARRLRRLAQPSVR